MNFKQKFTQILQALGFVDKAAKNELNDAEWTSIEAAFKEKYGATIAEAMADSERAATLETERAAALAIINAAGAANPGTTNSGAANSNSQSLQTLQEGVQSIVSKVDGLTTENKELQSKIEKMAKQATPDVPLAVVSVKLSPSGPGHTKTHLFGIDKPMFSMDKRWNKITINPAVAKLSDPEDEVFDEFKSETRNYGRSLAARYKFLKDNNLLEPLKKNASFTNDLTELADAGLGDQYVTLRQDALIARIAQIPTVYDLFPRRYGVQDRELMTIAYFEELSQGYQKGHVFKGAMKLQPELGYVDDAMFKTEFGPMKEIERQYIGYLNTDGSDPMKWSMIEWQLLNMYKVLVNEQNIRVIRGCFVKPEAGKPGSFLNAGTGLFYTLLRYIHENKLLPHSDTAYNDYTDATMLDAVQAFVADVEENPEDDFSLSDKFIYLNARHKTWWIQCIRTKFGKDTDFSGPDSYMNVVPDHTLRIKWVPNMGNSKLMFIQAHGNLQALEFVPGEMLGVKFDTAMELMHVWSVWKEGFSGFIVGKTFDTLAALEANERAMQEIFMNHPATLLDAGATTIDALASKNFWFLTGDNAAATALTDITGARQGVVYVIEVGTAENATTIAKSGKFANISEAFTPTAKGDYIMVTLRSDGNFAELERTVGGVRTINKDLQPNIPGGR